MAENQHNDNLERFFKSNLENYKPEPSSDFWARMEPVIPPSPHFWSGWKLTAARWIGFVLLAAVVVTAVLLWHADRQKLAKLSKTVEMQQVLIETMGEMDSHEAPNMDLPKENMPETEAPQAMQRGLQDAQQTPPIPQKNATNSDLTNTQKRSTALASKGSKNAASISKKETVKVGENVVASQLNVSQPVENHVVEKVIADLSTVEEAKISTNPATQAEAEESRSMLPNPASLGMKNALVPMVAAKVPFAKKTNYATPTSFPRFSVESGGAMFVMPMGRLFTLDTLFTGKTRISYNTGLLVNFEVSPSLAFQTGFQFKNIRAEKLALRYNSFPLMVRKQLAWNRRGRLEAKTGFSLNTLLNARTQSDGLAVKGLKNTWLGWHGSLGIAWPITEKLTLSTGPTVGFTLTRIADYRRTCEVGLGMNIRYAIW